MLLSVTVAGPAGPSIAVAAPAADEDEQTATFLSRLLDEINARRALVGTQPLASVPSAATSALDSFFVQTLPELAWPGPCVHQFVNGEGSWTYVQAAGFDGEMRGEVLACPGPEGPYWTPDRAAEEWWSSPAHFDVLYGDPDANAVVCSAVGVHGASGGRSRNRSGSRAADAATAVMCVTFHDLYASAGPRVEPAITPEPEPAPVWQVETVDASLVAPEIESADEAEWTEAAESAGEADSAEAWAAEAAEEPTSSSEAEASEEPAVLEAEASAVLEAEASAAPEDGASAALDDDVLTAPDGEGPAAPDDEGPVPADVDADEPVAEARAAWEPEPSLGWTIEPGAAEPAEIAASAPD